MAVQLIQLVRCTKCRRSFRQEGMAILKITPSGVIYRNQCLQCRRKSRRDSRKKNPRQVFVSSIKGMKKRGFVPEISVFDLLELWVKQNGLCALSGLPMTWAKRRILPTSITVDRIDSKKGYSLKNIRLVCYGLNSLRVSETDAEAYRLAKAFVSKYEENNCRS